MKKFFLLIFMTNIFFFKTLLSNPADMINGSGAIELEVVKPIQIMAKSNLHHTLFKGEMKKIEGEVILEVRASSNLEMLLSYEDEVVLKNKNSDKILLKTKDVVGNIDSMLGDNIRKQTIKNPEGVSKKDWIIPYEIDIKGDETAGRYKGIINILVEYI